MIWPVLEKYLMNSSLLMPDEAIASFRVLNHITLNRANSLFLPFLIRVCGASALFFLDMREIGGILFLLRVLCWFGSN